MSVSNGKLLSKIESGILKHSVPEFSAGDTVRVHAKIKEGQKERVQVFEGTVIRRNKGVLPTATFTVRKVSYNIGVERTFLLHSPRVEKIEVVARGKVRRARLFYLRPLRGKAAKIRAKMYMGEEATGGESPQETTPTEAVDAG